MANTFNAAQIVGKTLYALNDVNITRSPYDGASAVFKVKQGQPIGVVFSYLSPTAGRSSLWWMFYDSNKKAYYVEHKPGLFSTSAIKDQGGKDTETIVKEQEHANESGRDFWSNKALTALGIVAGAYLFKDAITAFFTGKRK